MLKGCPWFEKQLSEHLRSVKRTYWIFILFVVMFCLSSSVALPSNETFPLVVVWTALAWYCGLIGQDGIAFMQSLTYHFATHSHSDSCSLNLKV